MLTRVIPSPWLGRNTLRSPLPLLLQIASRAFRQFAFAFFSLSVREAYMRRSSTPDFPRAGVWEGTGEWRKIERRP